MGQHIRRTFIPDEIKMSALARLAGRVGHDINNILGAIEGYATLTASAFTDGHQVKEDMHEIRRAVGAATELMKQLLVFSRKTAIKPGPCDLGVILSALPQKLQASGWAAADISVTIGEGLPAVTADSAGIERALLNLVENAREAAPGGKITVKAAVVPRESASEPGFVKLSVEDTGPGLPAEVMERLFEPFFSTKEKGRGSGPGLGLAYVYGVVMQHKGRVQAESAPGCGSEFSFFLPLPPGGIEGG